MLEHHRLGFMQPVFDHKDARLFLPFMLTKTY